MASPTVGVRPLAKDIERFKKMAKNVVEKQIPHAAKVAVNQTAKKAVDEHKRKMADIFDRPTKFTLNSVRVSTWAKDKHKPLARLAFKDKAVKGTPADQYLGPQVYGGKRHRKRFTARLWHAGLIPGNYQIVPGADAPLNASGNVRQGLYNKILSQLGAQFDGSQNSTARSLRRSKARYFIMRDKHHTPIGIYERKGKSLACIFAFVRSTHYQRRYPFRDISNSAVRAHFFREFKAAYAEALRTAR